MQHPPECIITGGYDDAYETVSHVNHTPSMYDRKNSAGDWTARRAELINHIFGSPTLPTRSTPDQIETVPGPQVKGCLCSTRSLCNASQCQVTGTPNHAAATLRFTCM